MSNIDDLSSIMESLGIKRIILDTFTKQQTTEICKSAGIADSVFSNRVLGWIAIGNDRGIIFDLKETIGDLQETIAAKNKEILDLKEQIQKLKK